MAGRRYKMKQLQVSSPTNALRVCERDAPAAMLATERLAGVAPEVNLRECVIHTPLLSSNKAEPTLALKPGGDVTRSPKQGYQWLHKKDSKFFFKKRNKMKFHFLMR